MFNSFLPTVIFGLGVVAAVGDDTTTQTEAANLGENTEAGREDPLQ